MPPYAPLKPRRGGRRPRRLCAGGPCCPMSGSAVSRATRTARVQRVCKHRIRGPASPPLTPTISTPPPRLFAAPCTTLPRFAQSMRGPRRRALAARNRQRFAQAPDSAAFALRPTHLPLPSPIPLPRPWISRVPSQPSPARPAPAPPAPPAQPRPAPGPRGQLRCSGGRVEEGAATVHCNLPHATHPVHVHPSCRPLSRPRWDPPVLHVPARALPASQPASRTRCAALRPA